MMNLQFKTRNFVFKILNSAGPHAEERDVYLKATTTGKAAPVLIQVHKQSLPLLCLC